MSDIYEHLSAFINTERARFQNEHNNVFATSWAAVSRYRGYLDMIFERYKQASQDFIENTKAQQALMKPGTHPMTDEQMRLAEQGAEITARLHLEIESFYLFAKIFLDKVAHALEYYFGPGRGLSLDSHDDLTRDLAKYAELKGLTLSSSLSICIQKCKKEISDYRDYQIAHEKSPRTMRGTMYSLDGSDVRMFLNQIYPRSPNVKQIESGTPDALLLLIDEYLSNVLAFVSQNSAKTALKLEERKPEALR